MKSRILFELGELRYALRASWLRMPAKLPTMQVAGVACAKDDCLYVLTRNHEHPVMAFDPEGNYIETLGAELDFASEHGISVSSDDCLWVCDSGRHVVYKLTRRGEVVQRLGTPDVPCDNGFDPEVPYPYNLFTIRCAGAPFNRPTGAMEAPDGTIWCTDGYGNTSLHQFSGAGRLLRTLGGPGREPGKFRLPHALWIDGRGRIWVADRDNHRVQLFDGEGRLIRCFDPVYPEGTPYGPSTLWGDGHYIFCAQNSRGILVYSEADAEPMGMFEAPLGAPILGHSICGDSEGNLYIGHLHPEPMVTKLERLY